MGKNLHDIEDALNKAYHSFEEQPSANVWNQLNATLDNEDADKYRHRFIGWKRVAVVLLFLFLCMAIYETRTIVIKEKSARVGKQKEIPDSAFVTNTQGHNLEKINQTDIQKGKTNNENSSTARASESTMSIKPTQQKSIDHSHTLSKVNTIILRKKIMAGNIIARKQKLKQEAEHIMKQEAIKDNSRMVGKNFEKGGATLHGKSNEVADAKADRSRRQRLLRHPSSAVFLEIAKINIAQPCDILPVLKTPIIHEMNAIAFFQNLKTKKTTTPFKPYWSVTAFASNDWAQYRLNNDIEDDLGNQRDEDEKEEIKQHEKHEGSFSAGISATWQFSRHLGLKAGLSFSNIEIAISPQEMYAAKNTNGSFAYKYVLSSGYAFVSPGFGLPPAIGDSIKSTEGEHHVQMIGIPLLIAYRLDKKKLSVSPAVGLSATLITSAKVKTEVTDALNREAVTIDGLDGMHNFYAGLVANVSIQYNFNSKWSFSLLPGFTYALTSITKNNVVKTFPYSFNLGGGI
ncbi:MAG: outer membrane beta-barrel protein, partial [Bacteroidetes bacterium]|nr:outer membrane beta-barrel protein [Bacteroidota bacterium]